jgi:hypothetical protein
MAWFLADGKNNNYEWGEERAIGGEVRLVRSC